MHHDISRPLHTNGNMRRCPDLFQQDMSSILYGCGGEEDEKAGVHRQAGLDGKDCLPSMSTVKIYHILVDMNMDMDMKINMNMDIEMAMHGIDTWQNHLRSHSSELCPVCFMSTMLTGIYGGHGS